MTAFDNPAVVGRAKGGLMDQVTVEMKGVRERNRDELPTFESIDGTYVWIGDSSGCFVAITDLRTLRKMKAVLDEVVECRSRRSQRTVTE